MRFHVLVTPVADEAARVTREQALSGLQWLRTKRAAGVLTAAEAWPQTGGYMIAEVPDRAALGALLATYPLIDTINVDIHEAIPLDAGFGVLLTMINLQSNAART